MHIVCVYIYIYTYIHTYKKLPAELGSPPLEIRKLTESEPRSSRFCRGHTEYL